MVYNGDGGGEYAPSSTSFCAARMLAHLFSLAAIAVSCVVAQSGSNVTIEDVTQAFTDAKIVPDGEVGISCYGKFR